MVFLLMQQHSWWIYNDFFWQDTRPQLERIRYSTQPMFPFSLFYTTVVYTSLSGSGIRPASSKGSDRVLLTHSSPHHQEIAHSKLGNRSFMAPVFLSQDVSSLFTFSPTFIYMWLFDKINKIDFTSLTEIVKLLGRPPLPLKQRERER